MFNKRVNLLFEEEEWNKLVNLANLNNNNASHLIRVAIRKTYFTDDDNSAIKKAVDSIKRNRKTIRNLNYKALINYGRKI